MSILERAERVLTGVGVPVILRDATRLEVTPTDPAGFPVLLLLDGEHRAVYFDAWHDDDLEDDETALKLFLVGLTTKARLHVRARGMSRYRWRAEFRMGDAWRGHSTVTALIFPIWRPRTNVILQNDLISTDALSGLFDQIMKGDE